MIPIYSFSSKKEIIIQFSDFIKKAENIKLKHKTTSTIAFSINNQESDIKVEKKIFRPKGIVKKEIEEKTSSSAYHMPEGFLLRYGPNLQKIEESCFYEKYFVKTDKIKGLLMKTLLNQK